MQTRPLSLHLDPNSKIFLVGFMGSGKTTLGRLLAERLCWEFLALDAAMEDTERATIMRIFIEKGEPYFRSLEQETLGRLASRAGHAVIACGGGTFCSAENQGLLRAHGVTVWIDQPFDRIWQRRDELAAHRPLLREKQAVRDLYEQRIPFYQLANIHLPVGEDDIPAAIDRLLRLLQERNAAFGGHPSI